MSFWDWKTGHRFQSLDTTAQPGSLDAEAGLMSSIYDKTGLRLICGEADKTSKPKSLLFFPFLLEKKKNKTKRPPPPPPTQKAPLCYSSGFETNVLKFFLLF